ncbi:MAG TPA: ABC transporter permease [Ilumatobacteraceae bacterium]|nr:ABC transporter permease [Ilumatobacteraceae bacterium]HRB01961.1 ABC transporter permease [Ilumatobacteraceae bacterium]
MSDPAIEDDVASAEVISHRQGFFGVLGKYGLLFLGIALLAIFSIAEPDSFATLDNYRSILDNQTIVVLLAFAAMIPLIVGRFDLSVAAVLSISHVFAIGLIVKQGWSPLASILATLAFVLVVGLVNGILVVGLHVDAFVATLGTSSIVGGIALAYSGGKTIFGDVPASFTNLARGRSLGIPQPVILVIVVAVILGLVLGVLPVGRRMYATGGNERAARLTGINTSRYVIGAFVASSFLAGLAGLVLGSRLGTASPSTGASLLLPAFAGAFLGATTIRPGRFNVAGTIIAVYTLAIAVAGLQQMGAPVWFEPVFNGAALVLAVSSSQWALRQRQRRARNKEIEALDDAGAA